MGIIDSLDTGKTLLRSFLDEAPGIVDEAASLDVLPSMLRLPERDPRRESRDFFELAFGFIPTFNVGSALGIQGIPGLVADIALDPLNFLGMPGALTKTGKARKFIRAFARGSGTTDEALKNIGRLYDTARGLDVSALQYTKKIINSAPGYASRSLKDLISNARKVELSPGKVVDVVGETAAGRINNGILPGKRTLMQTAAALRGGGVEGANKFLDAEIARRMAMRSKVNDLVKAGGAADVKEVQNVAKAIRKLDKSVTAQRLFGRENMQRLRLAIEMERKGQKIATVPRATSLEARVANEVAARVDGMAQPGRALIRFKVPFTNIEHVLAVGGPMLGTAAKAAQKVGLGRPAALGLLAGAGRAEVAADMAFKRPAPGAAYGAMGNVMRAATDVVRSTPEKKLAQSYAGYHDVYVKNVVAGRTLGFVLEHNVNSYAAGIEESLPAYAKRQFGGTQAERVMGVKNAMRLVLEQPSKYLDMPAGQTSFVYGKLTEEAKKAGITDDIILGADDIRGGYESIGTSAQQEGLIEAMIGDGINTGYMSRIIKIVKGKEQEFHDWFSANAKNSSTVKKFYSHGEMRKIPFYEDLKRLQKIGVIEIVEDPALLLREYTEAYVQAASRAKVFKNLGISKVPLEVVEGGTEKTELIPMILKDYGEEYKHLKNRNLYTRVTDPSVLTFVRQFGITDDAGGILVHKDSAPQMVSMLKEYKPGKIAQAINKLNTFAKRSLLSLSAFHYMALTQSSMADLGWEFFRHPIQAIKSGQRSFFDASDEMIFAITKGGLTLGPMMDAEIEVVRKGLVGAARDVPALSKASQNIGKLVGVWDRGLWDYYHNASKLNAFHSLYANALARFGDKIKDPETIAKGVAQHVNLSFGGLEWERMMVSRPAQQWLRYLLLAPDWTLSNLGIATDVFANRFKKYDWYQRFGRWHGFQVGPEDVLRADVRAFYARRYAFHAAALYFPFMSMINHAFTGHHIWDNPKGHRTMVELPWQDEDGKRLFSDVGKQFREPMEFLEDLEKFPEMKFVRRKHSQVLGKGVAALTGRDLFTGIPIVAKSKGPMYDAAAKLWYFLSGAAPIPIQEAMGPFNKELGIGPSRAEKSAAAIGLGMLGLPIRTEFKRPAQKDIPEQFDDMVKTTEYKRQIERLAKEAAQAQSFVPVASSQLLPVGPS